MIVGYVNGNEGASFMECIYSIYYLLHATINKKNDVVGLLKQHRFAFACVLNSRVLKLIEEEYKTQGGGVVPLRIKNIPATPTNCQETSEDGVNLKWNFFKDSPYKKCIVRYGGPDNLSEKETRTLFRYLNDSESNIDSVLLLTK